MVDTNEANERFAKSLGKSTKELTDQEKKQALVELRQEVAKLAVQSASIIIDAELDSEKNNKLVDKFLSDLPKN